MKKKKVLAILLSMALVLGAVGCGSKEKPKDETPPKKETVYTEKIFKMSLRASKIIMYCRTRKGSTTFTMYLMMLTSWMGNRRFQKCQSREAGYLSSAVHG